MKELESSLAIVMGSVIGLFALVTCAVSIYNHEIFTAVGYGFLSSASIWILTIGARN